MIEVKSKDGKILRCELNEFDYNGTFMGECFISSTVKSHTPIDFSIGDYLEYRSEKFILNYTPAKQKVATAGSYGEAFVYDSLKFNSLADELTRCRFLDYVSEDNKIHFSSLPIFSFYVSSARDLAERIQVNLDRVYTGAEKWTVTVDKDSISNDKNLSVSNISCFEALALANSELALNFIIRGRTIKMGTAGLSVGKIFGYGKGNGLYDIEQTTNADSLIITRLRAYGSTRNLPYKYYNKLKNAEGNPLIPESQYVTNLMLPSFAENGGDAYIDSPNIGKYGVREGCVYFDGSDTNLPEIYPSMNGMTADDLRSAGIPIDLDAGDNGKLDEVVSAEQITDDGVLPEDSDKDSPKPKPTFKIILKDIGFDISKNLGQETATISIKSGMCAGREFEITGCVKAGNKYELTCNRFIDDGIGTAYPNSSYQIKPGDSFVLLQIEMPGVYVRAAEQRLLTAAKSYLPNNDESKYIYNPKIDEIFMACNPQLHDTLKEGDIFNFEDTDLDIDASVIIQSLVIHEGKSDIPTFELTLNNDRVQGAIEKIQNSVNGLMSNVTGVTIDQVKSLIPVIGLKYFISNTYNDTAAGHLTLEQGATSEGLLQANGGIMSDLLKSKFFATGTLGSGYLIKNDPSTGKSYIEVDKLYVRLKAIFDSLETKKTTHVGGQQMQTITGIKCTQVELIDRQELYDSNNVRLLDADGFGLSGNVSESVYRCFFVSDDEEKAVINQFAAGDFAQFREFNIKPGIYENVSNRYYWRYVVATGDNYIDLSVNDCDEGSNAPEAGDDIIQLGNRTDANRQNAIIASAYGETAPSREMLAGINSYSLVDKVVIEEGFDRITNKPYTKNYGYSYIGDRDENTYMRYSPDEGLKIKGNAEITGGSMTLKVSDEKVWKVNDDCVNIVGNPLGKRLEIDASTSKINIFNENSVLVNEIEGESYESLDDVFQGTIPVVTPVPEVKDFITVATLPIEEPIRIEKTTDVLNETYFYLDGTMEMLFNLAFSYTNGVTHGKGEAECGYELHVLKYDKVDGNIIRDIIIREKKASMGSSIVVSNEQQVTLDKGFYYRIVAKTFVSVKALSVSNSMHSYITLNAFYFKFIKAGYTSKFFANGLALGTSVENVFALFSKRDLLFGKYINMEAHNENAGFKIEFQKFLVKSNPNGNLECPYGLISRSLAVGKVKIDTNGASFVTLVCANSEDKYHFIVEKIIDGVCRIAFPKSWANYDIIGSGYIMLTVVDSIMMGGPFSASVGDFESSQCIIYLNKGSLHMNGSFFFEIKMY